jgi:hypothetical protein
MKVIQKPTMADDRSSSPKQGLGVVLGEQGGLWQLKSDDGAVWLATVARSCLVKPEPGDRVSMLCAGSDCWILHILERVDSSDLKLRFSGDVEIDCPAGSLSMRAAEKLDLGSDRQVSIHGPVIRLSTALAEHFCKAASWVGERLETAFDRVRSVSRRMETVTDQHHQSARISIRKTERMDRVEAGQLDLRSRDAMTLRGEHILARADKLGKIDADQIQLG